MLFRSLWVFRPSEGGWKACTNNSRIQSQLSQAGVDFFSGVKPGEGFFIRSAAKTTLPINGDFHEAGTSSFLPGSMNQPWHLLANPFVRTDLIGSQLPEDAKIMVYRDENWHSFSLADPNSTLEPAELRYSEGFFYYSTSSTGIMTSSGAGNPQYPAQGIVASAETVFTMDPLRQDLNIEYSIV